jgi:hypothetical protein
MLTDVILKLLQWQKSSHTEMNLPGKQNSTGLEVTIPGEQGSSKTEMLQEHMSTEVDKIPHNSHLHEYGQLLEQHSGSGECVSSSSSGFTLRSPGSTLAQIRSNPNIWRRLLLATQRENEILFGCPKVSSKKLYINYISIQNYSQKSINNRLYLMIRDSYTVETFTDDLSCA